MEQSRSCGYKLPLPFMRVYVRQGEWNRTLALRSESRPGMGTDKRINAKIQDKTGGCAPRYISRPAAAR